MTKAAVILSGCGHQDGAEIREAVLSLLYLDQQGAEFAIFAPDIEFDAVNHMTHQPMNSKRNVMIEAARIARGEIEPLSKLKQSDFDVLVIPGGFGVAKNLSDFAAKGADAHVLPDFDRALKEFSNAKKPIAAICIAPAVLAVSLGKSIHPNVTIGEDKDTAAAITTAGAKHTNCPTYGIIVDEANQIVTTSAYMRDDKLHLIAQGIESAIKEALRMAKEKLKAA